MLVQILNRRTMRKHIQSSEPPLVQMITDSMGARTMEVSCSRLDEAQTATDTRSTDNFAWKSSDSRHTDRMHILKTTHRYRVLMLISVQQTDGVEWVCRPHGLVSFRFLEERDLCRFGRCVLWWQQQQRSPLAANLLGADSWQRKKDRHPSPVDSC